MGREGRGGGGGIYNQSYVEVVVVLAGAVAVLCR